MEGGPPSFKPGSTCPVLLWCLFSLLHLSPTGFLPSLTQLSSCIRLDFAVPCHRSTTPKSEDFGLAFFPFARRYLGNRVCFLFLRVLRCFSSPRFLMSYYFTHMTMPEHYPRRVPPFGYLRIIGYVLLPAAFRSLSRPSSAPSAKASALCPSLLGLFLYPRFSRFIRFSLAAIHGAHVWAFFVKKLFLFFAFLASRLKS